MTIQRTGIHRSVGSLNRDSGAGLVEYALLLALISIVCLSALQVFGVSNGGSINNTADSYASATN